MEVPECGSLELIAPLLFFISVYKERMFKLTEKVNVGRESKKLITKSEKLKVKSG
jgi:hypothetical protein